MMPNWNKLARGRLCAISVKPWFMKNKQHVFPTEDWK